MPPCAAFSMNARSVSLRAVPTRSAEPDAAEGGLFCGVTTLRSRLQPAPARTSANPNAIDAAVFVFIHALPVAHCGRGTWAAKARPSTLLAHAACGNRPDCLHSVSAETEHAVVQIHGGVAVGNDKFEAVSHIYRNGLTGEAELSVLVAAPGPCQIRHALRSRSKRLVCGERFVSAIH